LIDVARKDKNEEERNGKANLCAVAPKSK